MKDTLERSMLTLAIQSLDRMIDNANDTENGINFLFDLMKFTAGDVVVVEDMKKDLQEILETVQNLKADVQALKSKVQNAE